MRLLQAGWRQLTEAFNQTSPTPKIMGCYCWQNWIYFVYIFTSVTEMLVCVLLYTQKTLAWYKMSALLFNHSPCPATSEIAYLSITQSKISINRGRNWNRLKPPYDSPYWRQVFYVAHCLLNEACILLLCCMTLHFGFPVASLQHRGQGVTPSINSLSQQAIHTMAANAHCRFLSTFIFLVYSLSPIYVQSLKRRYKQI